MDSAFRYLKCRAYPKEDRSMWDIAKYRSWVLMKLLGYSICVPSAPRAKGKSTNFKIRVWSPKTMIGSGMSYNAS